MDLNLFNQMLQYGMAWHKHEIEAPEIPGRRSAAGKALLIPVVGALVLEQACKTSPVITDTTTINVIDITSGSIGSAPAYSGQNNDINLANIVGDGYNLSRGAVWKMNGNDFISREVSIHGGNGSFRHDGKSNYAVFVCPSSINNLIAGMEPAMPGSYLGKMSHTVGYENDAGATVPSDGQKLWKDLLDDVSGSMGIPSFGSFGGLSGFPNGSDFTVGFGVKNYNSGTKVRSVGTPEGLGHMPSELIEHLTNTNNINGNTNVTIGKYGYQPILAFAYVIGD